ncbi:hypothetical protein H6F42_12850 [Pseudanabaena sp. FACHB-1998]|uniref:hypothetical protein n=1 Tax=Pseudanabaena sp. FACHB-1998 TaxID=2692858 RepID=UPI001680F50B|nr:hypothetical protein [Pseudanabaena sp. FACHB-1998]MBD2177802.1 hypothetical protein [Pseudanabaena sp. FACHB-1998]
MSKIFNENDSYYSDHNTDITAGSIEKAQQYIYDFFLDIVKFYRPQDILIQFEKLFIKYEAIHNISAYNALGEIIFHHKEIEFKNTLLRCCYILNNNWVVNGNIKFSHQLVDLFLADYINIPTKITKLKTLKSWLQSFVQSEEYSTLRSLSGRPSVRKTYHNWSERFSSYLLTSECIDLNKSKEQRQYAEIVSRKLKKQFKFDLALYTARLDSQAKANVTQPNPTTLGDGVLILIKRILSKQGGENFRNIAKAFRKRSHKMNFKEFKDSLLAYLGISQDDLEVTEVMRINVVQKLQHFQEYADDQPMTLSLLYVTCNRVLQYLLLNEKRKPSEFLRLSLEYNNLLNPVILLLKTVLICPHSRLYLESYTAELIKFYSGYEESECRSFINFLDMLNVILAVFDEDTDYSLIKMKQEKNACAFSDTNLDDYRIFSQTKKTENSIVPNNDPQNTTKTLPPSNTK